MAYNSPIPALPPLVSGVQESPVAAILAGQQHSPGHFVAAILAGQQHSPGHFVAAKKQLYKREIHASLHPQEITSAELVAAERRHHRIKMAQFDPTNGPNGNPPPAWVQVLLQRLDEMQAELYIGMDEIQQELNLLDRRLVQETQRSMNRSIRANGDRIVPVIRIEDGEVPRHFPATMKQFLDAGGPALTGLLQFYHLAEPHEIAERRALLRQHLGLNL